MSLSLIKHQNRSSIPMINPPKVKNHDRKSHVSKISGIAKLPPIDKSKKRELIYGFLGMALRH